MCRLTMIEGGLVSFLGYDRWKKIPSLAGWKRPIEGDRWIFVGRGSIVLMPHCVGTLCLINQLYWKPFIHIYSISWIGFNMLWFWDRSNEIKNKSMPYVTFMFHNGSSKVYLWYMGQLAVKKKYVYCKYKQLQNSRLPILFVKYCFSNIYDTAYQHLIYGIYLPSHLTLDKWIYCWYIQ